MLSQKVHLTTATTEDKHKDIEMIVNDLESRYKGLLEKVLEQAIVSKTQDEKTINELRDKLAEHKVNKIQRVSDKIKRGSVNK